MKRIPMNPRAELALAHARRPKHPVTTDMARLRERRYHVILPAKKDDTHTLTNRLHRLLSKFVPRHR